MSICPIDSKKLLEIERELCGKLYSGAKYFGGMEFSHLKTKIYGLKNFIDRPKDNPLNTVIYFEACDPRNRKAAWWVHLGVQLEQPGSAPSATYMMAVGVKGDGLGSVSNTLCKVHWDYEFGGTPSGERKPERHMQFGGRINAGLASYGYRAFWEEGMDKPRVPNFPVCFVILLHWAFLEFAHCEHVSALLSEKWWIDLVREAEEKTIQPYFERAVGFFRLTANKRKSFLTYGYY